MKVCAEPGCPTLTIGTRCSTHTRAADAARGRRQARGYGATHTHERARWQPIVDAGRAVCHEVVCLEPSRTIAARAPFDLAHTADRRGYLGPAHPRCNRAAAARRAPT